MAQKNTNCPMAASGMKVRTQSQTVKGLPSPLFVCALLGEDEHMEVKAGNLLCGASASIVLLLQPYLCAQIKCQKLQEKCQSRVVRE